MAASHVSEYVLYYYPIWVTCSDCPSHDSLFYANKLSQSLPDTCPSGSTRFEEYCYMVVTDSQTWYDAQDYCRSLGDGVELVKINSVEENEFVLQLVRNGAPYADVVWIGLFWDDYNGLWAWSDYSDPFYANWNDGEPNGNADEPCGEMYTDNQSDYPINGYWNDVDCYQNKPAVCKGLA